MHNGKEHGGATGTGQVQVEPRQAAQFALMFLQRVSHTRAERDAYDVAEAMLQAIGAGHVVLAPPPALPAQTASPGDAASP